MSIYMALEPLVAQSADVYADVRLGDNGDIYGMSEYGLGTSTDYDEGFRTWELPDTYGAIDSGWVSTQLDVRMGTNGTATYFVAGSFPLSVPISLTGDIYEVAVQATAAVPGVSFAWKSMSLRFFNDGVQTEQVLVPNSQAPKADTTDGGFFAQATTFITPMAQDNDQVIVSGCIRLTVAPGYFAGGNDVFGQVLINPVFE